MAISTDAREPLFDQIDAMRQWLDVAQQSVADLDPGLSHQAAVNRQEQLEKLGVYFAGQAADFLATVVRTGSSVDLHHDDTGDIAGVIEDRFDDARFQAWQTTRECAEYASPSMPRAYRAMEAAE